MAEEAIKKRDLSKHTPHPTVVAEMKAWASYRLSLTAPYQFGSDLRARQRWEEARKARDEYTQSTEGK